MRPIKSRALVAGCLLALTAGACSGEVGPGDSDGAPPINGDVGPSGTGGNADPTGPDGPATVGPGGEGPAVEAPVPEGCTSAPKVVPQRIVRLDYAQLENSIIAVLGEDALVGTNRVDPRLREFQALFVEGRTINTDVLRSTLALADSAASSVSGREAELAGCTTLDDACARSFIAEFAASAYRRPVDAEEVASATQLYTEVKTIYADSASGGVQEGLRSAVQGILSAPGTVYRTEIGAAMPGATEVALTPHELASFISYFVTNGPPDAALLQAAEQGTLMTSEGIRAEAQRLLATDAARDNLTQAMLAYYSLKNLDSTLKDPGKFPAFTVGLRNSMYTETELFIDDKLWNGKVDDLLTSRSSFVNQGLADLYGVAYPGPSGGEFVPVELPADQRAGLLTQPSILAMRARTDETSVVSRGLFVNGAVLCIAAPPPPPKEIQDEVDALLQDTSLTERGKADYRAKTSPCNGCHSNFDAYGLVLEDYDGIGRFRTQYLTGAPIDTSTTLPAVVGGAAVEDVLDLVDTVTQDGTFSRCMTANLMKYALADASAIEFNDCGITQAHDAFSATPQTFSDLVTEVMTSPTVSLRAVEAE